MTYKEAANGLEYIRRGMQNEGIDPDKAKVKLIRGKEGVACRIRETLEGRFDLSEKEAFTVSYSVYE